MSLLLLINYDTHMTHRVISTALMKTLHQQESKERSRKPYAWGLHMHDGTTPQWSCRLALCEIDLHTSFLHYILNDFTVARREKLLVYFCKVSKLLIASMHQQQIQAVASTDADTEHSNVENILRLIEKPDMKANHNVSGCQARCTGSNACSERKSVATDYTSCRSFLCI